MEFLLELLREIFNSNEVAMRRTSLLIPTKLPISGNISFGQHNLMRVSFHFAVRHGLALAVF